MYTELAHILLDVCMHILLLNPNTNAQTTTMMVGLVQQQLPAGWQVCGMTASDGVPLIANEAELEAAAAQVQSCWAQALQSPDVRWDGVILACFADPAIAWLRKVSGIPCVGIGEAALRAASAGKRRFGIATTTPELDVPMRAMVQRLGLEDLYTGARYTAGRPAQVVAQTEVLNQQLYLAVQHCVSRDGAQSVVIGGGPLGQAAQALAAHTNTPLIAPLTAAAQWMQHSLTSSFTAS